MYKKRPASNDAGFPGAGPLQSGIASMRKNKVEGAIAGSGRKKKDKTQDAFLNVRITVDARKALEEIPRYQRGKFIDQLIKEHFLI